MILRKINQIISESLTVFLKNRLFLFKNSFRMKREKGSNVMGLNNNAKIKVMQNFSMVLTQTVFAQAVSAFSIILWYYWLGEQAKIASGVLMMGSSWSFLFMLLALAPVTGINSRELDLYPFKIRQKIVGWYLIVALGLGILGAGLLFFCAPLLANLSGGGTLLTAVLRSFSFSIILFPSLQVLRSYFQSRETDYYYSFTVAAVSQLIYFVVAGFVVKLILLENNQPALIQGALATAVGVVAATVLLIAQLLNEKDNDGYIPIQDFSFAPMDIFKKDLGKVIPYFFVLAIPVSFKIMDMLTFHFEMSRKTAYSQNQILQLYSDFAGNPERLTFFLLALAEMVVFANLPVLVNARKKAAIVSSNIQLGLYFILPFMPLFFLLKQPLYTFFYQADLFGSQILSCVALLNGLWAFYWLLAITLQGLDRPLKLAWIWLVGLAIKIILQIPAILIAEVYGPVMITSFSVIVMIILLLGQITQKVALVYPMLLKRLLLIILLVGVSFGFAYGAHHWLLKIFSGENRWSGFLICLVVISVYGSCYLYLSLKIRLLDQIFGPQVKSWRRHLKIK